MWTLAETYDRLRMQAVYTRYATASASTVMMRREVRAHDPPRTQIDRATGRIRARAHRTARLMKGVVYASLDLTLQRGLFAPYILARRPNLDVVGGLSTNRPILRG